MIPRVVFLAIGMLVALRIVFAFVRQLELAPLRKREETIAVRLLNTVLADRPDEALALLPQIHDFRAERVGWALREAAGHGLAKVVRALLDRGAVIEARGYEGQTPLQFAARRGRVEVVRLLLDRG